MALLGASISDDLSSAVQVKVMQQYGMMIKYRREESDGHSDSWNAQLNLKFTRNMKDDPAAVNTHAMRHRGFLCEIKRDGQ